VDQLVPKDRKLKAYLLLLSFVLNELLLLLQDFESLLVSSSLGRVQLSLIDLIRQLTSNAKALIAYQVLGQTTECSDQRVHDVISLLLKVERSTEYQEDTRNTIGVM